ncbi:hypothetical protein SELMODRAFT_165027 [Selaginella moellendorffii]|uniref:Isopenicillin N synthase-like Fe(2+) 2OG dioxygenase domain-containing protein n=1 Tax=Selaginella moellendorffii TaxID=88036 RepID=D8QSE2_SELML|nr:uncharacterized protein LOC9662476 isoform X2 [Selaginella moellendorffii]EFJ37417.1 hypothetical protein SELMODRAFT_165027 [Selaginella moellendorffii]|eukprot:XP_024540808.1 uncharacterized protein LOC9662476 isoform X2 [Selaginella moellendorffii]
MDLPVVELEPYLEARGSQPLPENVRNSCLEVAKCLREAGALVLRDPRCTPEDNDRFLNMMERYFGMADEFKRQQERRHLHYQVGVTPEGVEVPRCALDKDLQARMEKIPDSEKPRMPVGADPKWRYMWRVGPRPANTRFKEFNADPVVPEGFPDWIEVMDGWGRKMIAAVEIVAEMAAIGFGLPPDAFTSLMSQGPHLLAPTGSDLSKFTEEGSVFAGYHYDLNFLTIHGRSRFPGLNIWLKQGQKLLVRVPPGCLLVQAGKELEWLTGGECSAGMHEVIVTKETIAAAEAAKQAGRSLWRVSSTVFGHIASDAILQPLGHFASAQAAKNYPATLAGDYVESELAAIRLKTA